MPKRFIKRFMPTPEKVRNLKSLHFLGDLLHEPNLWHINRHSVSRAFFIGIFWCFIPIPFQMILAAFFAVRFNGNLPVSLALVWISNPFTMPPLFYMNYRLGAWLLNRPAESYVFEFTWEWISSRLVHVGIPLYLGSLILAIVSACGSYVLIQYLWRRKVRRDWRLRQHHKAQNSRA